MHISQMCEYPLGHRRRRQEGIPLLWAKFEKNLHALFPTPKVQKIINLLQQDDKLLEMRVPDFMDLWLK